MALFRGDRRPVPLLRAAAWILALLAIFVGLFGVGAQRWPVAVVGGGLLPVVGLLIGAVALVQWFPVAGIARVLAVEGQPGAGVLRVEVDAPGVPLGTRVTVVSDVPAEKWPSRGDTLPIRVVNRRYLPGVEVRWDRVAARDPA